MKNPESYAIRHIRLQTTFTFKILVMHTLTTLGIKKLPIVAHYLFPSLFLLSLEGLFWYLVKNNMTQIAS